MTIHPTDPFATPAEGRSPVRRLRGRLPAAVTLWTARAADGRPAGLTVASTVVADGEPGRLLGLLDGESALWDALRESRHFAVEPVREGDRQLADRFAGLMPAPGGPFVDRSWLETPYGPVLEGAAAWAGCRLDQARPMGWSLLIEATIERVEIGAGVEAGPLVRYRGRYAGGLERARG